MPFNEYSGCIPMVSIGCIHGYIVWILMGLQWKQWDAIPTNCGQHEFLVLTLLDPVDSSELTSSSIGVQQEQRQTSGRP